MGLVTAIAGAAQDLVKATRAPGGPPMAYDVGPRGYTVDPLWVVSALRYKDKPWGLSYDIQRMVAQRDVVVAAILQVRTHQVGQFARPSRMSQDGRGFVIRARNPKHQLTPVEGRWVTAAERFFERCGTTDRPRDRFHALLKKLVRDSLTFDTGACEVVYDRRGVPVEFVCLDGGSIRIVHSPDQQTPDGYVQVIAGRPVVSFEPDELLYGVRNPRSDLRAAGYGLSEVELLIRTITNHLYAEDHSARLFCLHPETRVSVRSGTLSIADAHERFGDALVDVWTGHDWRKGRFYEAGCHPVKVTRLADGREIRSSDEHRFLVVGEDGLPQWRLQRDLRVDDWVCVADAPVEHDGSLVPLGTFAPPPGSRCGPFTIQRVGEDLWRLLGWLLTDGHVGQRTTQLHHSHTKELAIRDHHLDVLRRYGVEAVEPDYGKFGFTIRIGHGSFRSWLRALGFRTPSEGKRVPPAVFAAPIAARAAFLSGWYAADGTRATRAVSGFAVPIISVSNDELRRDLVELLASVGIAATAYRSATCAGVRVRDVTRFSEMIRPYQGYKEGFERTGSTRRMWDKVAPSLQQAVVRTIHEHPNYARLDRQNQVFLCKVERGVVGASRATLQKWLREAGLPEPEHLVYRQERVVGTRATDETVQMYDVEVLDEQHRFAAHGAITHNTSGSAPRGIFWAEGAELTDEMIVALQRAWQSQLSGVLGAHKIGLLKMPQNSRLQYQDLQKSNEDMGYERWLNYLVNAATSVFLIDPAEINFPNRAGIGEKPPMVTSGEEHRLTQSADKGLRPLMEFLAAYFTEGLLERLPGGEDFCFEFSGVTRRDLKDETAIESQQVRFLKTVNELRQAHDLPEIADADVILDPTFISHRASQAAARQMQAAPAESDEAQAWGEEEPDGEPAPVEGAVAPEQAALAPPVLTEKPARSAPLAPRAPRSGP